MPMPVPAHDTPARSPTHPHHPPPLHHPQGVIKPSLERLCEAYRTKASQLGQDLVSLHEARAALAERNHEKGEENTALGAEVGCGGMLRGRARAATGRLWEAAPAEQEGVVHGVCARLGGALGAECKVCSVLGEVCGAGCYCCCFCGRRLSTQLLLYLTPAPPPQRPQPQPRRSPSWRRSWRWRARRTTSACGAWRRRPRRCAASWSTCARRPATAAST
jgi:hypothetical protein